MEQARDRLVDATLIISAAVGAIFVQAMMRLWRNRDTPGALPCLLLFAAATVYLPSVLLRDPDLVTVRLGYVAAAMLTPLLFVATCDYAQWRPPGWPALRWLLPGAAAVLAVGVVVGDDTGVFQAIAAAPDLVDRAAEIRDARHGPLNPTTLLAYLFVALTLCVATLTALRTPQRRRDMGVLVVVCLAVGGADAAHYGLGLTFGGLMPTPFVIAAGIITATATLYRSRMFDVRPLARSLLIESVADAMLVVDHRRRVLDLNAAAEALLGRGRQSLTGTPAPALLPREFAAMLQSTVHLRSELATRIGGERRWFEVDVTPLTVGRRPAGHLMVAREITERRRAQEALEHSRRALEAANARLVEQSVTDPLTGLKNRRFLFQRLAEELSRRARSGEVLGLLVVDLDHFKAVNDEHGHPVGDEALIQVADTLERSVRESDVVARLGGEEFAILAVNTDRAGLVKLAERIRRAVARTPVARDTATPVILTASIGVAFAGSATGTADTLFAEADRYLYEAKRAGRNRVMAPKFLAASQSAG